MMIVMKPTATEDEIQSVIDRIENAGARAHPSRGELVTLIGAIGDREHVSRLGLEGAPGVDKLVPILKPYKLASSQLSGGAPSVARDRAAARSAASTSRSSPGPCTVESRDQVLTTADVVHAAGATMFRGGAYKPRTSPYAFQGLGVEGLRLLAEAKERTGLADRHRAHGRAGPARGARGRRRRPDRRAQHAELLPAERGRALRLRRAHQARPVEHARGAAHGGGVRR